MWKYLQYILIASHTQRGAFILLGIIERYKELLDVFYNQTINNTEAPYETRMYRIEDIKCTELKYIDKERVKDSAKKDCAK